MKYQSFPTVLLVSLIACLVFSADGGVRAASQQEGNDAIQTINPASISAVFHPEIARLTASDPGNQDSFGGSLAISGDTLIVGAFGEDGAGLNRGAVYIFERNQDGLDNWGQVKKLIASDPADDDWFGSSVAISGDTMVVGAMGVNSGGTDRGAIYIFERDEGGVGNWGQVKKLTAYDAVDLDSFGATVAISGNMIVVGAPRKFVASQANGVVYLYERNQGGPGNWGFVKKLLDPDMAAYNEFGYGLAISGDTIVVGAYLEAGSGTREGAAYLFERNQGGSDNWGNSKTLRASTPEDSAFFGGYADIDGDTVIISAYQEDSAGINSGAAYIFERDWDGVDNWGLVQKLVASDADPNDWFGSAVSIQGDNVVVGAYMEDGNGSNFGAAYVFGRDHGGADNWGQVQKLGATQPENNDFFGVSTAISGDTIVAGAYGEDSSRGAAYVYYQMQGFSLYLPLLNR